MEFLSLAGSYSRSCWRRELDLPHRDWAQPCPIFSPVFCHFGFYPALTFTCTSGDPTRPNLAGEPLPISRERSWLCFPGFCCTWKTCFDLTSSIPWTFIPFLPAGSAKGLEIFGFCAVLRWGAPDRSPLATSRGRDNFPAVDGCYPRIWGFSSFFVPPELCPPELLSISQETQFQLLLPYLQKLHDTNIFFCR